MGRRLRRPIVFLEEVRRHREREKVAGVLLNFSHWQLARLESTFKLLVSVVAFAIVSRAIPIGTLNDRSGTKRLSQLSDQA
jgi:hypothetical protein